MHRGGNLLCEGTLFGGVPQVIGEHLDDGPAQLPQTSTFLLVPHILFAEATVMIAIIFNSDFVLWIPDVYLEVQHPCWSCNSNSSSANASAGVR